MIDIDLAEATTVGIFGPVSSGKTYLKNMLAENMARVIELAAPTESFQSLENWTTITANPKELAKQLLDSPYYFRIKYFPFAAAHDFPLIFPSIWLAEPFRWFIADEMHEICPLSGMSAEMEILCRYSRHVKLGFLGASQRIQDVSKLFTDACRLTILFYTQESTSLGAIADRWGNYAADAVASLRSLIYDDQTKIAHQIPQAFVIKRGEQGRIVDL